ncbi:MAG: glycoside hydrolase family 32 protein [Pseudomonadales bacterium]|jgi:sucrose-6-phosphate hydrolase SacC (GH32 family)|nr:glycoside hydrolase family 32 protein [Pseudomonadales bacterium]MDP7360415.1 glycoside hydrolase family 32 protein [Pseudomonadales bacterium]MDP7595229.1 glycoside hydrolase family 32 protein [Pseudomonadales bacterium]HJN53114.1 glycoside hydrolase family 32 protein [Pseudomonadales bacterium]|tara:strand:+ start:678 stop:2027 length:1350 start_codon:yes stop_codon:yes gene_type:complete
MVLYRELHRPQFHFSPRENWTNDPNGLVYQNGVWHLFFQHNPEATVWGNMTWGHAVSDDLMHWRQLEHALYPDEHGTMFSGSAVVDHENTAGFGKGVLLAFYTAAGEYAKPKRPYTQCLAYSVDNGRRWTKYAGNPIIPWIEAANRDPKVVWRSGTRQWIMALYLAGDRYCLLNSSDARTWTRFQELRLEGVSECPDFFPLTDESGTERWVFWGAKGVYLVGSFDGRQFSPETAALICERGRNGYAAQTWSDAPDGRCIQISWMAGGQYPEMPFNQQMSIPVELTLAGSGNEVTLVRWPVRELDALRQRTIRLERQSITAGSPLVAATDAKLLDVSFTVSRQDANALYVMVRGQPLVFDWSSKELRFTNSPSHKVMPDRLHVMLPDDPGLSVRLLIDTTSVEVFINQGLISASFCFLPNGYVDPLVLQSYDGEQTVDNFDLHEMASIWT